MSKSETARHAELIDIDRFGYLCNRGVTSRVFDDEIGYISKTA